MSACGGAAGSKEEQAFLCQISTPKHETCFLFGRPKPSMLLGRWIRKQVWCFVRVGRQPDVCSSFLPARPPEQRQCVCMWGSGGAERRSRQRVFVCLRLCVCMYVCVYMSIGGRRGIKGGHAAITLNAGDRNLLSSFWQLQPRQFMLGRWKRKLISYFCRK